MTGEGGRILVSVVVPVYNAEHYLERCIESLTDQTWPDVEIILIDDGSTDGSRTVCERYARESENIRVFHQDNQGVSSARNAGISHVKGDYLIFIDSDDCVHRELIEIYIRTLKLGGVPVCEFAEEERELSVSCLDNLGSRIEYGCREHFMKFLYDDHVNSPCNKLYDTKIIREHSIRFDERISLGEDFLFNLQYLQHADSEYRIIHCPLYYQERRAGSLQNAYCSQLFGLQKMMFEALYAFLNKLNIWNEENQSVFYRLYWDRLYMTIGMYIRHAKIERDQMIYEDIQKYLNDPVWKELEGKHKDSGLGDWKYQVKKMCLKVLKLRLDHNWL